MVKTWVSIANLQLFVMPIFCGPYHLLGGQFRAISCYLLGGQSTLLSMRIPTQLTCY